MGIKEFEIDREIKIDTKDAILILEKGDRIKIREVDFNNNEYESVIDSTVYLLHKKYGKAVIRLIHEIINDFEGNVADIISEVRPEHKDKMDIYGLSSDPRIKAEIYKILNQKYNNTKDLEPYKIYYEIIKEAYSIY